MGELAWDSLSADDQAAWALSPAIPECAPDFFKTGPQPRTVREKMGRYSVFLDLMGWRTSNLGKTPEFLLPGGQPVPHGGVTPTLTSVWSGEQFFDAWGWRTVLRTFVPRMVGRLRAGENEQAALCSGLLAHFVEDGAALGHLFPNHLFYDLLPEADAFPGNLHRTMDFCEPSLDPVKPRLLGTSVPEFVFRLGVLGEQNYQLAKRQLLPFLGACTAGDSAAMDRLAQPLLQNAVAQVVHLLHTAVALGRGPIPESESEALTEFDLTQAVDHFIHPSAAYGPVVPRGGNIVENELVPLRLDFGKGPETVETGLGMSSFHSVRHLLEPGAFARVEGAIGLSTEFTEDQAPDMDLEFFVGLDRDWNRRITSDLEYGPGMARAFSCRLRPGEPAQSFSVALGQSQTLCLGVLPYPKQVGAEERCWFPHVVLARPRLVKS